MRNTTLIQGSGLLLLLVFWNSVTWHLQRFWDASGYFCQTQWEKLLSTFEGYEWILYYIGVILVPGLCFWGLSGLLLLVDTTEKPTFISRYRIQRGKNEPVDPVKLRQAVLTVLFNQNFISIPMLVIYYPFLKWRRDPCSRELPTFHWFLVEMAFFTLLQEILFYYAHRLFHHPMLYKKSHKKHHEWTAPIGVVSIYADPPEHVVANMLPVLVGPLAMGSHLSSITVWLSMVLIVSIINHTGYHLPFLPSPEFHDYHHLKSNQCYGVLGLMDHLHGTDTLFKQTKAYERHVILLGFTPLSESIPDSPKKTRSAL
ncbi:fatty acid hydroxylase domain-containing protein 2 [Mus musculus]|uniref:Fatty acid hydroxylase domain containing 2 n=1 Tax=Mus musculus TaxID=10090 RepID=A0A1W2P8B8_MOUSE|nr:fatty acid hydroxylase domain-containing protein 2 [Mus musculus]EDL07776.1 mCG23049 [Mus musculus]